MKKSVLTLALLLWLIPIYLIGCGDGENGQVMPTPTPRPIPTAFPPECNFVIDLECFAESLTELPLCYNYSCNLVQLNTEIPETVNIGFLPPSDCHALDCFTLECEIKKIGQEMFIVTLNIMEISSGGIPSPPEFSGIALIEEDEFDFVCPQPPIP